MNKIILGILVSVFSLLLFSVTSVNAADPVLFGDATIVSGGNPNNAASLPSNTSLPNGYSGATFSVPDGTLWTALTTVSSDYNITDDNCGGGSPRFQIKLDTNNDNVSDGNVHVAIGPSPSFSGCTTGWQNTGNIIGNEDAGRYDFSTFGGSPFTTYSGAPASVLSAEVLSVQLVVDGSWSATATGGDSEQTILVDNVLVNSDLHTFDPVLVGPPTLFAECKGDLWKTFNNPSFDKKSKCEKYVKDHMHTIKGNDVIYTAYGLKREADMNMNTGDNAGSFEYDDSAKGWYNVKVSSVKVDGNHGWFAGRVVKASNPAWVGLWLFAKVEDNGPDKIWGSFTDEATALANVQAMIDPADGAFNVTKKDIKVQ